MTKLRLFGVLGVVFGLMLAGVSGQVRPPIPRVPGASASLDDLLQEVRGFRADLNQSAGASMRMQLLLARLQLQEHRITAVADQLEEVKRMLVALPDQTETRFQMNDMEEVIRDVTNPPEKRKGAEAVLMELKARLRLFSPPQRRIR